MITKEEQLYQPIKEAFLAQGFTVHGEVINCDVTAVKDDTLVVVEMKRHLSLELVVQGAKRQKSADLVYLAVPKPKRLQLKGKWRDTISLLRRLNLGLIVVGKAGIEIMLQPSLGNDKSRNKKRIALLNEISGRHYDLNIGGSKGKKLVTAYREASIFIACCLKQFGSLSPKQLRQLGTDDKKTTSILNNNHYGWFTKISRGLYQLSSKGECELRHYPKLVEYYLEEISQRDGDHANT